MARPLRVQYPGATYHVTTRGNDKGRIFLGEDDREKYLEILETIFSRHKVRCHAYCLMDNHLHLLVETPEGNLAQAMKEVNGTYTGYFNWRHGKCGHLFQGRYKAVLIQKESHLLEVARYVVLNPVQAKMVEVPQEWRWSSYRAMTGEVEPPGFLETGAILSRFHSDPLAARQAFVSFITEGMGRDSPFLEMKGGLVLGDPPFIKEIQTMVEEGKSREDFPRRQRWLERPGLETLFPPSPRKDRSRRNQVILLAITEYGYRQKEVAEYLGLNPRYVSQILTKGENWKNET